MRNRHGTLTKPLVVAGIAVLCTMLWGSAFPLIKIGYGWLGIQGRTGGMIYFASYRFFLAALIMFTGLKIFGRGLGLRDGKEYMLLALIAFLQTALQFTFFYIGLSHTTGMKAAIINGSGSFFIVILSHMFMAGDRLTINKIMGVLLGFAGLVIVNFDRGQLSASFTFLGEGFILLTSIAGAFGSLLIKKSSLRVSPAHITAYQFLIGAVMLFFMALAFESPTAVVFDAASLGLLLYLSVISAASFSLWYLLIKHNNLSRIAVYFFLVPIWGTVFSAALVKNELLTTVIFAALSLVSLGIYFTNREAHPAGKGGGGSG